MARSKYLNGLNEQQSEQLRASLSETQNAKCFICQKPMATDLQADQLDVDHIVPLANGGKDNPDNFALTHASCNRSKQDADLRVARSLAHFAHISELAKGAESRSANLGDVLADAGGATATLSYRLVDDHVEYSLDEVGDAQIRTVPVYVDKLSKDRYFFIQLPVEYLHHDAQINPRNIGSALSKLVKEFYSGNPQLHVALAWLESDSGPAKVMVFDGQHKAAAQLLLGTRRLPVRVFLNPDTEKILATNTRAGTTLRQVAFDKSVQRRLGASLFSDRVDRYRKDHSLPEDNESFSELEVASYFSGQRQEVKRYAIDSVRNAIVHNADNKLAAFIEFGGRAAEKPLSYSTVEKTYLSKFVCGDLLETPMDYQVDEGRNPRVLEVEQIVRLMNIVAEEVLIDRIDTAIGGNRLENKVAKGEHIDPNHLRAYRLCREEVVAAWMDLIAQVIKNYFSNVGTLYDDKRLFQNEFTPQLWERLKTFVHNFANLPVWINPEFAATAFGGKRVGSYWPTVFKTGKTVDGTIVLAQPLNLMEMIKD